MEFKIERRTTPVTLQIGGKSLQCVVQEPTGMEIRSWMKQAKLEVKNKGDDANLINMHSFIHKTLRGPDGESFPIEVIQDWPQSIIVWLNNAANELCVPEDMLDELKNAEKKAK